MKCIVPFRYIILCIASLLGLSGSTLFSWPSPVIPTLTSTDLNINPLGRSITEDEAAWLTSILFLGATIGPVPFGIIAARWGRKIALLGIALLHVAAFLTFSFAASFPWFCVMRVCNGLAFGSCFAILPVYLSEIAETTNRGIFTTVMYIFCEGGNLLPFCIGPYIPFMYFNIFLSSIPATFFLLFISLAPESPYFLLRKNRKDAARQSLVRLGTRLDTIEDQLQEMAKFTDVESWSALLKTKAFRKGLIISLLLRIGQDLTGMTAILPYSRQIFAQAGVTEISPTVCSIILGGVAFLCTFIVPFFIDRFGRRFVLLVVTLGSCTANFCLGLYFYLKFIDFDLGAIWWFPILCLGSLVAFFGLGYNSVPHTICSEMFETSVRPIMSGVMSAVNWLTAFFITYFFTKMIRLWGEHGTFWFYSVYTFLTFLFVAVYVPETKRKTFFEIQNILAK